MLRRLVSRVREWIAVEDPEERIEGTGEPIMSPKNRRCAEAESMLRDSQEALENRPDDRFE
ncbi:hypothetical protein [Natrarchaeobius chitinivorans]|uniref:Uncharacterized protein n=1 Tax=Natrarchaeobius chitinivorans TaxID=1679083 RepID=A0A3N6MJ66_NATCH|nr:hypothetical protein [Natrarchaeobius chitinivorans]RQG97090.1 hypothetical protein EA473_03155 [Natrarchaeobius chitinivorans]